jgi:hypothetical protein
MRIKLLVMDTFELVNLVGIVVFFISAIIVGIRDEDK